jgi:hypothetical protein
MDMDVQSFNASYENSTNNTTNNTNNGYDVHHMQINQGSSLYDDICEDSFVKDIEDNNIDSKRFKNSTRSRTWFCLIPRLATSYCCSELSSWKWS